MTERIHEAIVYAGKWYAGQVRKGMSQFIIAFIVFNYKGSLVYQE